MQAAAMLGAAGGPGPGGPGAGFACSVVSARVTIATSYYGCHGPRKQRHFHARLKTQPFGSFSYATGG